MHVIDLNDIHAFVVSADAGGFSAAAQRLNLSRSAVGRAVARLEQRLGARLLHRTTRQLSLTSDGVAFLERCQRALDELQAGQAALNKAHRQVAGRLRVSVPVLFGRVCVVPVLAGLAEQHASLELQVEFSDRVVDLVADGFELAVRNGALGNAAGLMRRKLMQERAVVCAAPSYLDRVGTPDSLDALPAHHAITYARRGRVQPWLFPQQGARPLELMPPTRMRFDDLGAITDAAVAGLGLAWLPSWLVADRLREGTLVRVLPDVASLVRDIHALWPRTPSLPLRVRLAIDALARQLRSHVGEKAPDSA
jgi:DNA-binding transcriptional LysR family regulator